MTKKKKLQRLHVCHFLPVCKIFLWLCYHCRHIVWHYTDTYCPLPGCHFPRSYLCLQKPSHKLTSIIPPVTRAPNLCLYLSLRDDEGRGDVLHTAWLQDAPARKLSVWAVRDYDNLLEGQAWRQTHLWLPTERPGRLLHRDRGSVPRSVVASPSRQDIP